MPRAQCEACGKFQSPDWKAGDLCSFCGKSVRHDVRCYWCAKWVPAVKFCRSCGAAIVEERLYGAARMLKDAGTDRFTIPKQLKEFDPDQIENFTRIYQRHATAVAGHVDSCRYAEQFLRQKHWSAALEDQLIPQLPWPEDTLARMTLQPLLPGEPEEALEIIGSKTPFPATRSLAALARLRRDDWKAYKEALAAFRSDDPTIKAEAALALTTWRVLTGYGRPRDFGREIYLELEKSPYKTEAAVGIALLGGPQSDLLKEALASPDKVVSFGAALALGEVDRLQAALNGDDLEKIAAGNKLISLGIIKPVVKVVEKSPLEVQQELVESLLRRKEPAPEAAETLMEIVETTQDKSLRERAARILCRRINPGWVLRIARAAQEDRHIYQSLLQAEGLPPETALELGDFLIANGHFAMHQYGLSALAEKGGMPDTFVPSRFSRADDETRLELLRFAESQLEQGKSEELHRFVMSVVFGPYPAKTRAAAWSSLHRWYRSQGEYRGEGPFKLETSVLNRFFGSVGAFVPKLAAVLRDHDTLKEVGYYEMMAHVLGSADDATVAAIQAEASAAADLVRALIDAVKGDYWPNTIEGMMKLLSRVGCHPRWRDQALEGLRALDKKGNYHYDKAVRRLELSAHGLPEESEWKNLPADFIPSRFREASVESRREFLKVVDHQIVHHPGTDPDPALFRFLVDAALRSGDAEVRIEAMRIHADRARGKFERFPLRRDAVEHAYGPFPKFLEVLADALRDAPKIEDDGFLGFLSTVFGEPKPGDGAMIAAEGEAGRALIEAMLAVVAAPPSDATRRLRQNILRHLEHSGTHESWRDAVVQALDRLRAAKGWDLSSEGERLLQRIRPAKPDRPEGNDEPREVSRHSHPVKPVTAPPVVDYAEKGRIAQKMGAELQAAIFVLMAGPGTPEDKMREATRMSEEYQAKIKALYNP
jgi:hypothetical protein